MKTFISSLFPVLLIGLFLGSCKKDTDSLIQEEEPQESVNHFSCKLNGETFSTQGFYAYATTFSDDTYNIYGVAEVGESVIYVSLPNNIGEGTHQFSPDVVYGIISLDNGTSWTTNLGNTSGTVVIEEKTATRVKGTFSFKAASFDDLSVMLDVTEGVFDVEMR